MAVLDAELEERLVARCRAASSADRDLAFRQVYDHFEKHVFGLCLHLTGRRQEAEDALQEVFLGLFRSLPRFRGDARLSTFIYRITIRVAHRVRSRVPRHDELIDTEKPTAAMVVAAPAHEEADLLRRALDSLPAESRTVMALFALQGMTHKEIATILHVPEGTVWSRLHNAKKALSTEMARLESDRKGRPAAVAVRLP